MLDCLILGDSIAVGTHQFMHECRTYSQGGLNSHQWNHKFLGNKLSAETVIISLGTNDHQYVKTADELVRLREQVKGKNVYWVLPMGNSPKSGVSLEKIQDIIYQIADVNGDAIITTKRLQSDGIHPSWAGYKELVNAVKSSKEL